MIGSFDIGEKNFAYSIGTELELCTWKLFNVKMKKNQSILESCLSISKILEFENWANCEIILIEQQMRANIRAQRLAQHVWTWFSIKFPTKMLVFVPSNLKTQYFVGKNSFTYAQRKAWAVQKVSEILHERKDTQNLEYMNSQTKKDDIADTYLQLIAWYNLKFKPKSKKNKSITDGEKSETISE